MLEGVRPAASRRCQHGHPPLYWLAAYITLKWENVSAIRRETLEKRKAMLDFFCKLMNIPFAQLLVALLLA